MYKLILIKLFLFYKKKILKAVLLCNLIKCAVICNFLNSIVKLFECFGAILTKRNTVLLRLKVLAVNNLEVSVVRTDLELTTAE